MFYESIVHIVCTLIGYGILVYNIFEFKEVVCVPVVLFLHFCASKKSGQTGNSCFSLERVKVFLEQNLRTQIDRA